MGFPYHDCMFCGAAILPEQEAATHVLYTRGPTGGFLILHGDCWPAWKARYMLRYNAPPSEDHCVACRNPVADDTHAIERVLVRGRMNSKDRRVVERLRCHDRCYPEWMETHVRPFTPHGGWRFGGGPSRFKRFTWSLFNKNLRESLRQPSRRSYARLLRSQGFDERLIAYVRANWRAPYRRL